MVRAANVLVRLLTMTGKFILVMVMAKYLSTQEVALYGLLTVTIGYLLMIAGLDFYNYSNRQILKTSPALWSAMLRDQAVFF
jgi:O-antigen/teichoic acid export membrane protein